MKGLASRTYESGHVAHYGTASEIQLVNDKKLRNIKIGSTFILGRKWLSSYRHYARVILSLSTLISDTLVPSSFHFILNEPN